MTDNLKKRRIKEFEQAIEIEDLHTKIDWYAANYTTHLNMIERAEKAKSTILKKLRREKEEARRLETELNRFINAERNIKLFESQIVTIVRKCVLFCIAIMSVMVIFYKQVKNWFKK